ncbi:MAG: cytochrome c oxidase assembly factor Coa1 family protein [Chthoniobacterales bacterium]
MDQIPPPPIPPTPHPVPRPGWWSRNWKWFVPMGCLTFVGLIAAFVALMVLIVFGAMKSGDVYKHAVAEARANPEVAAALGTPLKEGMFISGTTNVNGASGNADLAIPISGPKGAGTIYAVAEKSAGQWTYSKLEVEVKGSGKRIGLQPEAAESE